MIPRLLLPLLLLGACKSDDAPAWAVDPIWVEPTETGVHGFQTWELYTAKWEKKQKPSTFLCAVIVEFEGTETPCTDCQIAWATTPAVLESDCDQAQLDDPIWTGLQRLSIGLAIDSEAHPGLTSQGFADYGFGWEVHGEAWPDAVEHGGSAPDGSWTGSEPFHFSPTLAWPL